jgi:hypothetical protein
MAIPALPSDRPGAGGASGCASSACRTGTWRSRHIAYFLARHLPAGACRRCSNGGVMKSPALAERVMAV